VVEGPDIGLAVPLAHTLEIGTGSSAGIRLHDPHIEAVHARVSPSEEGAYVEDLGEPGGTFVNDAELHAPTTIRPGDQIQVGATVLELRAVTAPAERPAPPPLASARRDPGYLPADVLEQDPIAGELEDLLDVRTKTQARVAPIAIFTLVVLTVLLFLLTSKI
jgi:hypothetical protein